MRKTDLFFLFLCLCIFCKTVNIYSCTGITLRAKDGAVVFGRTLEWGGVPINSDLIIVPRAYKYVGSTPLGKNGLEWNVTYAFAALNVGAVEPSLALDGLNEKGLHVGAFYFPDYAKYEPYDKKLANKTLAPIEFPTWLLSKFATVKEVRDGLHLSRVVPVILKAWGLVLPLHCIVTDATGASIVIEHINGKIMVYDNPIGVITNSPGFDWHLANISNYVNLSPWNKPPVTLGAMTFNAFGNGSGMLGLPGDFTPPSRFVRATFLSQYALSGKDGYETVRKVFHVLNQFDIPEGTVRSPKGKKPVENEMTQWTSAADTKNRRFYFHTVKNRRISMLDLDKIDEQASKIVTIPVYSVEGTVVDVTPKAKVKTKLQK